MQTLILKNLRQFTEQKSEKEYYIEGYISTSDLDRVNDIVTKECLDDMLNQIKTKNIKLDIEHEVTEGSKIPIGKIVDARLDTVGLYVKAVLNTASEDFPKVWDSIKNGFLDSFSILYKPIQAIDKFINGKKARMLNKLDLVNVAITGNPVNPQCLITETFAKSLNMLTGENMESTQEDKKTETPMQEQPCLMGDNCPYAKKYKAMMEEQKMCGNKKAEEPAKEKEDEMKKSIKDLETSLKSLSAKNEEYEKKNMEMAKQMEEMKSLMKAPILKAIGPETKSVQNTQSENKSLNALDLIR